MKVIVVFLVVLLCDQFSTRNVTFESFDYSPEESELIDYGNLKLKKGKTKSVYTLKGNYSVKKNLGNEKLVSVEILNGAGVLLVRSNYAFCEFMRNEKMFWPELLKSSNMPKDNPCPFPAVSIC